MLVYYIIMIDDKKIKMEFEIYLSENSFGDCNLTSDYYCLISLSLMCFLVVEFNVLF